MNYRARFDGFVRIALSNEHLAYGRIYDEDDTTFLLKDAILMYENGRLWRASEILINKSAVVEIKEAKEEEIYKIMRERVVNLGSNLIVYASLSFGMFAFYMALIS